MTNVMILNIVRKAIIQTLKLDNGSNVKLKVVKNARLKIHVIIVVNSYGIERRNYV